MCCVLRNWISFKYSSAWGFFIILFYINRLTSHSNVCCQHCESDYVLQNCPFKQFIMTNITVLLFLLGWWFSNEIAWLCWLACMYTRSAFLFIESLIGFQWPVYLLKHWAICMHKGNVKIVVKMVFSKYAANI